MSSFNVSIQSRNQKKRTTKTFCKICFDAGKTEKVYTCHFLKDKPGPDGKVVCPTLLSTKCRYCRNMGHFKSHCPVLLSRTKNSPKRVTPQMFKDVNAEVQMVLQRRNKNTVKSGQFSALDDIECVTPTPKIAEWVATSVVQRPLQGCWATKVPQPTLVELPITPFAAVKLPATPFEAVKLPATPFVDPQVALLRIQLAVLQLELESETQDGSGSWAASADIEDIEDEIEEVERQLSLLL